MVLGEKNAAWSLWQTLVGESQCISLQQICPSWRGWEHLRCRGTHPVWEPLSKMFSRLPPAQMFYGSFLLWVCSSPGNLVLFIWGPVLPVTCPHALPTAAQEKAPYYSHPEALVPNGLRTPARGIANVSSLSKNCASFPWLCPLLWLQKPNLHWFGKPNLVPSCMRLWCVCVWVPDSSIVALP